MKKKVSSCTFFSHPAGLPETELFLWSAWVATSTELSGTVKELRTSLEFSPKNSLSHMITLNSCTVFLCTVEPRYCRPFRIVPLIWALGHPEKTSFPVQRVATIVSFKTFFFWYGNIAHFCKKKKRNEKEMKKKEKKERLQSHLFYSPGRWTGNRFFF